MALNQCQDYHHDGAKHLKPNIVMSSGVPNRLQRVYKWTAVCRYIMEKVYYL